MHVFLAVLQDLWPCMYGGDSTHCACMKKARGIKMVAFTARVVCPVEFAMFSVSTIIMQSNVYFVYNCPIFYTVL